MLMKLFYAALVVWGVGNVIAITFFNYEPSLSSVAATAYAAMALSAGCAIAQEGK